MTICIAAIGKGEDSKELIVFATDHMISNPAIGQFERPISKYKQLDSNAIAMLAGDPLIFGNLIKDCIKGCDFDQTKDIIHKNMNALRSDIVQKQVLDIFKMDYEYIKQVLRGPIQNPYIGSIIETISKFNLMTLIILIGFKGDDAQITEIAENRVADLRGINFSAIGSGSVQAINTLMFQRHSKDDSLATTVYNVYKAKRNAEVSIGVGKETDLMVLTQTKVFQIDSATLQILAKVYDEELKFGKTHKKLYEALKSSNQ